MISTFLVSINHGDDTDLQGIADEIKDTLDDAFDVQSVAPWTHPSLSVTFPPEQQNQQ